jgi:hypothetical protein
MKDIKAIIKKLDEAAALANKDAYTQDLVAELQSLADKFQEKLEEA